MDRWQLTRTVLLFLGGMLLLYHETAVAAAPRDALLLVATAMMGLPLLLNKDENKDGSK